VRRIPVRTASANYDVFLQENLLLSIEKRLKTLFHGRKPAMYIVTSPEVWALWAATFLASFGDGKPVVLFVPAGEKYKTVSQLEQLATRLSAAGADRSSVLVAFGGGVIGDITGFLAAIYMRGIDYVQVPTTLLAQVDSSVGGKTGVNLRTGKNLIGAFHHPAAVFVDVTTLATLLDNELRAGLFESIKAGLIRDRALFTLMERERASILKRDPVLLERVIIASVKMKAEVVGRDERESGLRMLLNFGHTVGHAIEAVAGFGKLLHGEAVGWGMLAALAISRLRGLPDKDYARAVAAIRAYGLPPLPRLPIEKLLDAMARDKKNASGLRRFILLRSIGEAYVTDDVSNKELFSGIASMVDPERP